MNDKYGGPHKSIICTLKKVGEQVRISLHSEGEPISVEGQVGLFQQFRRTRSAETSGKKGWGLGLALALVHGIVEAHGGRVWVESGPHQGTTFIVQIPSDTSAGESSDGS